MHKTNQILIPHTLKMETKGKESSDFDYKKVTKILLMGLDPRYFIELLGAGSGFKATSFIVHDHHPEIIDNF